MLRELDAHVNSSSHTSSNLWATFIAQPEDRHSLKLLSDMATAIAPVDVCAQPTTKLDVSAFVEVSDLVRA